MKQMNNSKKVYMAPMLEVMNVRVEKGFAGSGEGQSLTQGESYVDGGNHQGNLDMD